jgi:hypothetical protein
VAEAFRERHAGHEAELPHDARLAAVARPVHEALVGEDATQCGLGAGDGIGRIIRQRGCARGGDLVDLERLTAERRPDLLRARRAPRDE